MDHKRMLLIKTVKKLCLATNILKVCYWFCSLSIVAAFVILFIPNPSIKLVICISLLITVLTAGIVILILFFQIRYYEEVKEFLEQIIFNKKLNGE